jgi:hypothetical protein
MCWISNSPRCFGSYWRNLRTRTASWVTSEVTQGPEFGLMLYIMVLEVLSLTKQGVPPFQFVQGPTNYVPVLSGDARMSVGEWCTPLPGTHAQAHGGATRSLVGEQIR